MSATNPTPLEIMTELQATHADVKKLLALLPASSTTKPPATTTPPATTAPPTTGTKTLPLKQIPWQSPLNVGGVPFGVWYARAQDGSFLKSAGVNLAMNVEHNPSLLNLPASGIKMALAPEWLPADIPSSVANSVIARMVADDEIEMNDSYGQGPARLTQLQNDVASVRTANPGMKVGASFGRGNLGSYWPGGGADFHDFVTAVDFATADNYAYTSPGARFEIERSAWWPTNTAPWTGTQGADKDGADSGPSSQCSWAYYWQAYMLNSIWGRNTKPVFIDVETARPFLNEAGAGTITATQIRGAVWAALIGGASGIMFFEHNNDPAITEYSLEDTGINTAVAKITAEVQTLAWIINSPSYVFTAGAGVSSMTKQANGSVYLFVIPDLSGPGMKTITLPSGVTGTVEVVGESRTITPNGTTFTDTFAAESDHHIYRATIA